MHLVAPQYSDGLDLYIWPYKIQGGGLNGQHLAEINNLNHYIGMKAIEQADFLEMIWMPFVFGLIILLILRAMVFGEMNNVVDLFALYTYFGLFSIGSFWYRLYQYGHNLDPRAPVHIEPFTPLLIGVKQIANFANTATRRRRVSALHFGAADCARRLVVEKGEVRRENDRRVLLLSAIVGRLVRRPADGVSQKRPTNAATLQERIDAAAPGRHDPDRSRSSCGSCRHPEAAHADRWDGAEIRGHGAGNVVTIAADDVTLTGLRITGSGLRLSDDDAAVFVTGNRARIENNVIADSLHGIYLKKVSGAQILHNRIEGKTTLTVSDEPVEKRSGKARRTAIRRWFQTAAATAFTNGTAKATRLSETRSARRGTASISPSPTTAASKKPDPPRPLRTSLHVFGRQRFPEQHVHGKRGRSGDHVLERSRRARQPVHQQPRPSRLRPDFSVLRPQQAGTERDHRERRRAFVQSVQRQRVTGNRVTHNYIGLRFGSNSDGNRFTENVFTRNLHPVETGGSMFPGTPGR